MTSDDEGGFRSNSCSLSPPESDHAGEGEKERERERGASTAITVNAPTIYNGRLEKKKKKGKEFLLSFVNNNKVSLSLSLFLVLTSFTCKGCQQHYAMLMLPARSRVQIKAARGVLFDD